MEELEVDWIDEFEEQEHIYEKFYPDKVKSIKIFLTIWLQLAFTLKSEV